MKRNIAVSCFVLFLLIVPPTSAIGGPLRVVRHFLSHEEVANYRAIEGTFVNDHFEGLVLLDSEMVARYRALEVEPSHDAQATCTTNADECLVTDEHDATSRDLSSFDAQKVKVTMITSTIREHTDVHVADLSPVAERVCVTFLDSNPNARFVYGDREVPVEAGSLVLFHGNVSHSVQVDSGEVHFLGPFAHASFRAIGIPAFPVSSPNPSEAPSHRPSEAPMEAQTECFFLVKLIAQLIRFLTFGKISFCGI